MHDVKNVFSQIEGSGFPGFPMKLMDDPMTLAELRAKAQDLIRDFMGDDRGHYIRKP